jgi:hypothetical protein
MTTLTLPTTTLEPIEVLDFDVPISCDSELIDGSTCVNPAELRILRLRCPACRQEPVVWLHCRPCWVELLDQGWFTHAACRRLISVEFCVLLGPIGGKR